MSLLLPDLDRGTRSAERILEGFRQGLRDFGLQANPNWLMLDRRYALKRLPNGRVPGYGTRLREVFSGHGPHPDALIGGSDVLACTAITCLKEDFGLRVPEDILVAGLGDLDDSAIVGLTSAPEPVEAIGREAAQVALAQIDGESTSGCVFETSEVYYRRTTEPPDLTDDAASQ